MIAVPGITLIMALVALVVVAWREAVDFGHRSRSERLEDGRSGRLFTRIFGLNSILRGIFLRPEPVPVSIRARRRPNRY